MNGAEAVRVHLQPGVTGTRSEIAERLGGLTEATVHAALIDMESKGLAIRAREEVQQIGDARRHVLVWAGTPGGNVSTVQRALLSMPQLQRVIHAWRAGSVDA